MPAVVVPSRTDSWPPLLLQLPVAAPIRFFMHARVERACTRDRVSVCVCVCVE